MAASNNARLQRVLLELAECKDLDARERLAACAHLAHIKANKPAKSKPKRRAKSGLLGE